VDSTRLKLVISAMRRQHDSFPVLSRVCKTSASRHPASGHLFEEAIEEFKGEQGVEADTELTAPDLKELVGRFRTTENRLTVHSLLL
jgi:hypothetical protein